MNGENTDVSNSYLEKVINVMIANASNRLARERAQEELRNDVRLYQGPINRDTWPLALKYSINSRH